MRELFRGLAIVGTGLMGLVVAALVSSRRWRECVTFASYMLLATVFSLLIFLFPANYTPQAFIIKQGIYDTLLFLMAVELSIRAFAAFRGVADRIRVALAGAVIASSAAILVLTPQAIPYSQLFRYQPGITTAGIWCLTFVSLLIAWYQIPVPSFTRALLLSFVPYQLVFVVCVDLIGRLGWGAVQELNLLNAIAYDVAAAYWAVMAWRKD